jgi:hypothetical protein
MRLSWNNISSLTAQFGVDRGVFYPKNGRGYAWNGLVSVKESTPDASQKLIYIDGVGHQNLLLMGHFAASIDAITYPPEFEPYDGYSELVTGRSRGYFDFSYRTLRSDGTYILHLVYNAKVQPTQRNNSTINQTSDVALFSWELNTKPEQIPDCRPSSHFIIDTASVYPVVIGEIEDLLYGDDSSNPHMPTVPELLAVFEEHAIFKVIPHGDGTVTIIGPDEAVEEIDPVEHLWKLDWPSVIQVAEHTYEARSL